MKKNLLILFLLLLTASAFSQNINGRFSSSLYAFERFDTVDIGNSHWRAFQLLSLNVNKDNFSLRTYFNLETDLAKDMIDDPRLRFYNLYLEARNLFDVATLKLGRQPIFHSVVGGVFDGVNLDIKYDFLRLTGYYGANVPAYQKLELIEDWNENFILGGKLSAFFNNFRLSLGYVDKNFQPASYEASRLDNDFNPINVLIRNKSNQFRLLTGEAGYNMKDLGSLDLRYDYDINFETTSRFEANAYYTQIEDFNFNLYYNYREPLIRYNSIFSVFDFGNTWEIEGGADYKITKIFSLVGRYGTVNYRDESSQRLSAGINSNYGSILYRKNFGYAGELDGVSLYTARTFLEGMLTPSVGLSFSSYRLTASDQTNTMLTLLGGVNVRPVREFSADIQAQYLNNKIYRNDLRLFLRLNYWFNTNLNIF
jgi:hypothetical protein